MMPAIKKAFDLIGDDIVGLSTENNASKGNYDEKRVTRIYIQTVKTDR